MQRICAQAPLASHSRPSFLIQVRSEFNMKKLLKILGIVALVLAALIGVTYYLVFGNLQKPRTGPQLGHSIEQVADSMTTVFILDAGNG